MENWQTAYKTKNLQRATIVRDVLEQNNIPAFLMDKKDRAYAIFGNYEIKVQRDDLLRAKQLIENDIKFE
ncbi:MULTISPECIES: putative signal transducing protein [Persicobacter]|uniref:DUF2007 domain-containing protein n=1 Tax=Persicobacter diffluens TaxID=981 RepID=A0AAN4W1P5_9BACT|nr:DUF2007 domain-containing protein [Persicobacter sp. CCB-QB2]GJM62285.1 hypothetical protein PEDI_28370 [Persicobacter diffluens]